MTKFNPNILDDPLGTGLELAFGFPECLVNLTKDLLSLLPGDILGGIAKGVSEGKDAAQDAMATVFETIHDKLGILEYDSTTGKLSLLGNSSQAGVDKQAGSVLGKVGETLGFIAGAGMALYQAGQDVSDQIEAIQNCLQEYEDYLDAEKGGEESSSVTRTKGEFFVLKAQAAAAQAYIEKADRVLGDIATVLGERSENPDLIPIFAPVDTPLEEVDPIFRLTFGPPKAKTGQFLLSVDGLYYDSQTRTYADGSPVPTTEDLKFIPNQDRWKLDHSPNLGGRGTAYSIKDLNDYVDTIFDPNKIDNSTSLETFYEADHFLQVLEAQRNQVISNLGKNIKELQTSGYSPESALHINYTEQIKSQNAAFNRKIHKRKKQIEVAVKAPDLFGSTTVFPIGEIPINDFSYLSSINLDVELEKQRNLVFDQGEVSGIILPIVPTYVHSDGVADKVVLTPLEISETGVGSNIEGEGLTSSPMLSLTTNVNTHGLQAIYNFADVNTQSPASTEFKTLNCATLGTYNRAQLVSTDLSLLYQNGLGLPYLNGIPTYFKRDSSYEYRGETWDSWPFEVRNSGNYIKFPDTSSFQNLMYSKSGATVDVWTRIPGLFANQEYAGDNFSEHAFDTSAFGYELSSESGAWCDFHYYRVLLGCENTGGDNLNIDQSSVIIDRDSTNVRGMVMGFSRDPRMFYEDGIVAPADTDLNPRQNFGGYVTSVSTIPPPTTWTAGNNVEGIWTLSSDARTPLPNAFWQASGTFITKKVNGVAGSVIFTLGTDKNNWPYTLSAVGEGYTSSSNDTCCVFWASGDGGVAYENVAISAVPSIAPFNQDYNVGTTSSVFFIAPTQSYNTSTVGFVKNADCNTESADILKFVVSTKSSVGGVDFEDITSKFVNLQIVFDPINDLLKFYVNGVLFKQQALSTVFGVPIGSAPQVPSFIIPKDYATSSFYYSKTTVTQSSGAGAGQIGNQSPTTLFDNGPNTYPQFTPWVMGGGWTDGRPVDLATSSGGFMDTGAGIISPYNGFVGNVKFYNRALDKTEVLNNYKAQKDFFENIDF